MAIQVIGGCHNRGNPQWVADLDVLKVWILYSQLGAAQCTTYFGSSPLIAESVGICDNDGKANTLAGNVGIVGPSE